ncbi:MAG: hypothetical protein KatS3mg105_3055 [Gemmatales bacterium]|nr:MAG: hypothetical protein KatS3mg105_3055 [Gemmatales bacterium]
MNSPESSDGKRPVFVWLCPAAAGMILLAFAIPVTQLFERELSAADLLRFGDKLVEDFEQRKAVWKKLKLPDREPVRPKKTRLRPKILPRKSKLDQKRAEVEATTEMIRSIVQYTRWGLMALLITALVQIVPPSRRWSATMYTVFGMVAGVLGVAFAGTLMALFFYLNGIQLLGQPIFLRAGYWSATAGTMLLAVAGFAATTRKNWFLVVPIPLLVGGAWTVYFASLLF